MDLLILFLFLISAVVSHASFTLRNTDLMFELRSRVFICKQIADAFQCCLNAKDISRYAPPPLSKILPSNLNESKHLPLWSPTILLELVSCLSLFFYFTWVIALENHSLIFLCCGYIFSQPSSFLCQPVNRKNQEER